MPCGAVEMELDGADLECSPAKNSLSTGQSCPRGWWDRTGQGDKVERLQMSVKRGQKRAEEPGRALGSPGLCLGHRTAGVGGSAKVTGLH